MAKYAKVNYSLEKQKHRQGDVVQRFGKWQATNMPTVLIPNTTWAEMGKPNRVIVEFCLESESLESKSKDTK